MIKLEDIKQLSNHTIYTTSKSGEEMSVLQLTITNISKVRSDIFMIRCREYNHVIFIKDSLLFLTYDEAKNHILTKNNPRTFVDKLYNRSSDYVFQAPV